MGDDEKLELTLSKFEAEVLFTVLGHCNIPPGLARETVYELYNVLREQGVRNGKLVMHGDSEAKTGANYWLIDLLKRPAATSA